MTQTPPAPLSPLARIGLALGAGLAGAAVMLVSQKIEMKASGRAPSDTPAKAIETLAGFELYDEAAEARLSTFGHFAFGTGLGLGLAAIDRVPEPWRTLVFASGCWAIGTGTLVGLGVSEPPTRWGATALATDLGHHAVYAAASASAYAAGKALATR
ncbi:hypothetical protein [Sphingomonas morindae]|uniref:DUF1440 domain-containing protein n=1 Tax=Sphingomonas morindae TaxID=1541170 RepID=A0ABY4X5T1_9SPHN|nr:hypothetical protein [Sphingomonas morindae]USI72243.1 hypothetical protein LHA26_13195 [Sphingomonas morindae]